VSAAEHAERTETLRRFKPYPTYRHSGVEWLGQIPTSWGLKRLKRIVAFQGGGTPSKDNREYWKGDIPWVSPKDMKVSVVEETEDRITTEAVRESATKLVPAGAVLIVVRSGILAHSIPVALAGLEVTLNQDLKALIPASEIAAEYLMYLIAGMQRELLVEWKKEGATVESLELDLIARTPTPLPAIPEQRAIATFLDRETARIDALVEKKERLVELLQEQRTALITRAVTKGLDPNVLMKDSGVEWLGEIPAHWYVKPLKHVTSFINGFAFKPDEWGLDGTPIIRIENLNGGDTFNYTARQLPTKYCADEGDLLFGWSGNRGTSFGPFLWWRAGKHYVNQHIFRVVGYAVDKVWLYWALRAVTSYVEKQAHGIIGMVHVTRGELGSIPIPVLEPEEQVAIARHLETEHARIDELVAKIRDAIDRLKELRTALISAAVTGKIDLREEVA
jgi:type I restriction enzyme, S subunit